MRTRRTLLCSLVASVAAWALAAGAALAQSSDTPRARAAASIALVIDQAVPAADEVWRLRWSGFAVRGGGQPVHWHLADPVDLRAYELETGVTRRGGWMDPNVSVAVCGVDAFVRAVAFRSHNLGAVDAGDEAGLREALEARGFILTPQLSRPHEAVRDDWSSADDGLSYYRTYLRGQPALAEWRLEKPGRAPAVLTASHHCTPPGTRSATRCWTSFSVVLRGDFSHDRPEAALPGERCAVPGR